MRAPHPKTIIVGLLAAALVVLAAYFIIMDFVVLPRAEATLDRVGLHLEASADVVAGERGALVLQVDNRRNDVPVRVRDVVVSPELATFIRFDGQALRAQGAELTHDRIAWGREIPGGAQVELTMPFEAARAGRQAGALRVLFEVPRMTKGRFLPLTLEVR